MLKDYAIEGHERKGQNLVTIIQAPKEKLFRTFEVQQQKVKQFVPLDSKKAWEALLKLFRK